MLAGISPGVVAGICVAVGLCAFLFGWYLVYIRRKKKKEALLSDKPEFQSAPAGTSHLLRLTLKFLLRIIDKKI